MDLRDWELIVVALVGLAGIGGTLWATRMANRNSRSLMQAQWERDDLVAKRSAGKEAAKDLLTAFVAATELFEAGHWRRRKAELEAEFGGAEGGTPDWLLGPALRELEPHDRVIRHRLLEVDDPAVVADLRRMLLLLWNHEEAIKYGDGVDLTGLGSAVRVAAETVLAAYIQGKRLPDLSASIPLRRASEGVDAAVRHWEEMAAENAAHEAAREAGERRSVAEKQ